MAAPSSLPCAARALTRWGQKGGEGVRAAVRRCARPPCSPVHTPWSAFDWGRSLGCPASSSTRACFGPWPHPCSHPLPYPSLPSIPCRLLLQVDVAAAAKHGIRIVRVPAYSPRSVAEHALALTFALARWVRWVRWGMSSKHAKHARLVGALS